jgi:hypothetical protein
MDRDKLKVQWYRECHATSSVTSEYGPHRPAAFEAARFGSWLCFNSRVILLVVGWRKLRHGWAQYICSLFSNATGPRDFGCGAFCQTVSRKALNKSLSCTYEKMQRSDRILGYRQKIVHFHLSRVSRAIGTVE